MNLQFKRNLGNTDRLLRTIIGLFLIFLTFSKIIIGGWAIVALVLGLFQIIEATIGY